MMRKNTLKYCLTIFCLLSNFIIIAANDPGMNDEGGVLENDDIVTASIDNYIMVLILIGLIYVFMKYKALRNKKVKV